MIWSDPSSKTEKKFPKVNCWHNFQQVRMEKRGKEKSDIVYLPIMS